MNEMQIFNNPEFGNIRVIGIAGEPWMVGKDVADTLGYSNQRDALATHKDGVKVVRVRREEVKK